MAWWLWVIVGVGSAVYVIGALAIWAALRLSSRFDELYDPVGDYISRRSVSPSRLCGGRRLTGYLEADNFASGHRARGPHVTDCLLALARSPERILKKAATDHLRASLSVPGSAAEHGVGIRAPAQWEEQEYAVWAGPSVGR